MTYEPISTEPCPCGHPACKKLFLVGIGSFVQGSGFAPDEADEVVTAVNTARLRAANPDTETFTDAQGFTWVRPTAWAYFASCRANHWRTAQLHAHGIVPRTLEPDDPCMPPEDAFDAPAEPVAVGLPKAEQPEPDAPAPDSLLDLVGRVSNIIRKEYFTHTRNERKSYDCAQNVLQEVMRTYEQLAERAAPESLS